MTVIELRDGYFIEVDEMNSTLKQRYVGEKKTGEKKEAERIIGYYSKPKDAMKRFAELNRTDKMDGMRLYISEYVNELKKADAEVLKFLSEMELADFKPCRNQRCKNYEDDYCTERECGEDCPDEV